MALTFAEYWQQKTQNLIEMAQSNEPAKGRIVLDDQDDDFIAQATAHEGITPQSAIRARYTTLLQDKVPDGGKVRFFIPNRQRFVSLPIARTHLHHLQQKLRDAGFTRAADHGLSPIDSSIEHGSSDFYEKAFGRQNSADVLKNRFIDINNKHKVGKKVDLGRSVSSKIKPKTPNNIDQHPEMEPQHPDNIDQHPEMEPQHPETITKPVSNTWASKHIQNLFSDRSRANDYAPMMDFKELPASNGDTRKMYDFSAIWKQLETIVGDTSQPNKYILPEVWEIFKNALPNVGEIIFQGVRRKLLQFSPSSLSDPMEVNHAMLQTTAMILSDPVRKSFSKSKDPFIVKVKRLLEGDGGTLASYAASKTAEGYVRHELKINTNNTGNREYVDFGPSTNQDDKKTISHGDQVGGVRYDMDKEIDDKHALSRGEDPDDLRYLDRTQINAPEVKRPIAGENSPAAKNIKAQIQAIEPQAHKIMAKLDAAHWNTSAVTDDEWDIYSKYEKLEKEYKRAVNAPIQHLENSKYPFISNHRFQRNEVAGASGTLGSLDLNNPDFQVEGDPCSQIILGFNAWCKKRERKKGWDGIK